MTARGYPHASAHRNTPPPCAHLPTQNPIHEGILAIKPTLNLDSDGRRSAPSATSEASLCHTCRLQPFCTRPRSDGSSPTETTNAWEKPEPNSKNPPPRGVSSTCTPVSYGKNPQGRHTPSLSLVRHKAKAKKKRGQAAACPTRISHCSPEKRTKAPQREPDFPMMLQPHRSRLQENTGGAKRGTRLAASGNTACLHQAAPGGLTLLWLGYRYQLILNWGLSTEHALQTIRAAADNFPLVG